MANARKTSKKTATKAVAKKRAARKSGSAAPRRKPMRPRVDAPAASRCAHGGCGTSSGGGPTGTRGPRGATGATGPSGGLVGATGATGHVALRSESRSADFPLPSGRRVYFFMSRRAGADGRAVAEVQIGIQDAEGNALLTSNASMTTTPGKGPAISMSSDGSRMTDFPPLDMIAMLEEAGRLFSLPDPYKEQVGMLAAVMAAAVPPGPASAPKVKKNGATVLHLPEGGLEGLVNRATVAFKSTSDTPPGYFVCIEPAPEPERRGTAYPPQSARDACEHDGDVYEFTLNDFAWIVGVPREGA